MNDEEAATLDVEVMHCGSGQRTVIRHDPNGTRTPEGARAAFMRGDIDAYEFERRLDRLLRDVG